ncbi:serine hydrolase domain-containing protein [Hyphomonas sp. FCG-A18]|uniref:serine hydrolase domain-containing protein n=1 Tax=Hyphomonas sp. FCG-A18 TaxID=3080019 RepID=UPI002B2B91BA|nr:serine hydrolase domain-containing protein [Hyphomonas sp. FCG-A18]
MCAMLVLASAAIAQPHDPITPAADARFGEATATPRPGFAVGVIQNGELIHESYWGYANLEHQIKIDAASKFYIASMSKQFTAALIGQLIEDEKLSLNDSVRTYLPDLPEIYEPVTIAHCMWHTSGVREYTSLLLIRGDDLRGQDRMTHADALALISQQVDLDFAPGTEMRYSSSGYVLLSAVIEAIEDTPFREVAEQRLFDPLGMDNTLFDDDHGEIVLDRVQSYRRQDAGAHGEWRSWLKHFDVVGDGGVLTTLTDLEKWDRELSNGKVLGKTLQRFLKTQGVLNDGTELPYGGGLWLTDDRAVESHGGGMGGFISDQIRFPELGVSVYVLANRNDDFAFQGWAFAADVLTKLGLDNPLSSAEPSLAEGSFETDNADDLKGAYFLQKRNNRRFVRGHPEGGLALHDGGDAFLARLHPQSDGSFLTVPGLSRVAFSSEEPALTMTFETDTYAYTGWRYDDKPPSSIEQVRDMAGRYCSNELKSAFELIIDDELLLFQQQNAPPIQLFPTPEGSNVSWNGNDRVWTGAFMLKKVTSSDTEVMGFDVGDGRVSGVSFHSCAPQ